MLGVPLIFRKEKGILKQVYVYFELPEAMLTDTKKSIKERFSSWLVDRKDNRVAAARIFWLAFLQ